MSPGHPTYSIAQECKLTSATDAPTSCTRGFLAQAPHQTRADRDESVGIVPVEQDVEKDVAVARIYRLIVCAVAMVA